MIYKILYIACIVIGVVYIYGLLSKFLLNPTSGSNSKKNKEGKKIEYKDADFEEID